MIWGAAQRLIATDPTGFPAFSAILFEAPMPARGSPPGPTTRRQRETPKENLTGQ
jgi:hypothetical protein